MISKKLDAKNSGEDDHRDKTLDKREEMIRATERQLQDQQGEIETQRRKMTELVKRMEDELSDGRHAEELKAERIEREHARLIDLQRAVKEEAAGNRAQIARLNEQAEEERRILGKEYVLKNEALNGREREVKQSEERLKALEAAIEQSR